MSPTQKNPVSPSDSLSFEQALAELEVIVRDLESGKTSLEDSIAAYERGVALKQYCDQKLKDAQMKIEKIVISSDGKIATQPFDPEQ